MRMLSGRMHWLTVGLALLVSAQGFVANDAQGQSPLKPTGVAAQRQAENAMRVPYGMPPGMAAAMSQGMPPGMGGVRPAGGMMTPDAPMSMSFPGPPPMEVAYASAQRACSSSCDSIGGCNDCGGCNSCGGSMCGGRGCGILGRLGNAGNGNLGGRGNGILGGGRGILGGGNGIFGGGGILGRGCGNCGGAGCGACLGNGCLFSGRLMGLLGSLAPYSEGGRNAPRWFDLYAGTMALQRGSDFGGFASANQDPITGQFARSTVISTNGVSGTPVLSTTDLDLDKFRYGLELVGNLQTGVGANLEFRYFGMNNWNTSSTVSTVPSGNPTLYSAYSQFGVLPAGGFDDTDRSFIHTISYNSELHNGEVNYRRNWASPFKSVQGSWLAGIRYFDLDERFAFSAIGSNNNTFTFDQLRFFEQDTRTRNQLTGFQLGGDMWVSLMPGLHLGVGSKGGIFGNHAEVESSIIANSIPGAREFMQDGKTAYMGEFTASMVYRLTYSWSFRAAYNLLYIENVALAPENFNVRDISNAIGGGAFTVNRFPFLDVDGEVLYQGFSLGGEFLF